MKYLGETFDIHTGGIDHIPVHHNNEIAQSECATGEPYAHYWMHNAFVNVQDGKMSKSLGNFVRLATLEKQKIHPLSYRYWLLTAHYRSPVMFSEEAVLAAQTALESIVRKVAAINNKKSSAKKNTALAVRAKLREQIENDLNTPATIALLHATLDEILTGKIHPEILEDFEETLGLPLRTLAKYMITVPQHIRAISKERDAHRNNREWEKSDMLRKELENQGYLVEDTSLGTQIYRPLSSLIS